MGMLENNPSGKPRNTRHHWKYPTLLEIPEIPGYTRKKKRYLEIPDRIFGHCYPNPIRYPVFCPIPDPILKNPTRWALVAAWNINFTNRPAIHWFWVHPVSTALGINVGKGCLPRKAVTLTVRGGGSFLEE